MILKPTPKKSDEQKNFTLIQKSQYICTRWNIHADYLYQIIRLSLYINELIFSLIIIF